MVRSSSVTLSPRRTISLRKFRIQRLRGPGMQRRYIEDRMPRRANLNQKVPAILAQRRRLSGRRRDFGIGYHAPDHIHRLICAHRIRDQNRLTLRQRETAGPLF